MLDITNIPTIDNDKGVLLKSSNNLLDSMILCSHNKKLPSINSLYWNCAECGAYISNVSVWE